MAREIQPWERLIKESEPAWVAFETYRKMTPPRRLRGVTRDLHKSLTLIGGWSRLHHWVNRVRAYDAWRQAEELRAEREALAVEARKWAKRMIALREVEWERGAALGTRVEAMLKFPLVRQVTRTEKDEKGNVKAITEVHPAKWTFDTLSRWVELESKLKRLAAGVPVQSTAQEIGGPGGGPIQTASGFTPEELERAIQHVENRIRVRAAQKERAEKAAHA
jgi:hypothetical protein